MAARVYSCLKTLFVERLSCARVVLAVPQRRRIRIVRILITVSPLMYRESLALAIHRSRPDFEVLLGAPESLDGQAESFRPHLLIRNDTDGADMSLQTGVMCWIEVLYSNGLNARVSLDGEVWEIEDIGIENLLEIVERAEELIPGSNGRVGSVHPNPIS
jgi:hypothetical protein